MLMTYDYNGRLKKSLIYNSICMLLIFSSSCTKKAPCENTPQNIRAYTYKLMHNDTLATFQNLSIFPSDRGGHHLSIWVTTEKGATDQISVTRFLLSRPQAFRFYVPSHASGKLISEYTGASLYSKQYKRFWQQKLTWLVKHDILSISHDNRGFMVTPTFTDTSYHELKRWKKDYFDKIYEHHSKEVLARGCEVKYRYELMFLEKNPSQVALNRLNVINRERTKVYQIEPNCYYFRTMSLSAFCSLEFKYAYCPWNGG